MFGTKYRPLDFSNVLGLEDIKFIFQKILKKKDYDTAYLFSGDYSTGKTTLGRLFVRSAFCQNKKEDMSPCNECPSCKSLFEDRHPGYLEIDAATNGSKEKLKQLLEDLNYESVTDDIFILIDECHNLSKEGVDVFLKELEKENRKVHFIFCTTEIGKMSKTLRSRCMEFNFIQPTESDVKAKIVYICEKNNFKYDPNALDLVIKSTGRHYRDAENKLKMISILGDINVDNTKKVSNVYFEEVCNLIMGLSCELKDAVDIGDYLVTKMNIKDIYDTILRLLVDSLKYKNGVPFDNPTYTSYLEKISKQYSNSLFEIIDFITSKNRLNDLTTFQSDLLLVHYKLLRNQFDPKELKPIEQGQRVEMPASASELNNKLNSAESSWDKSEIIRKVKKEKLLKEKGQEVEEKYSATLGPEIVANKTDFIFKKDISREQLKKHIGGALHENRV